jgi:hypothetical protein
MKKSFILISFIFIASNVLFSQIQPDTLYFDYNDFYTHKIFSLNLNYSHDDSLSQFKLSGNNKLNNYSDYSKNHNDINVLFLIKNRYFNVGGEVGSYFDTNTSGSKPTYNEFSLMPLIQMSLLKSTLEAALGYTSKNDDLNLSRGLKWSSKLNSAVNSNNNFFKFNATNTGDNLDKQINYYSNFSSQYFENLTDNLGDYSLNGQYVGSQYHYYDSQNLSNRINKKEYSLNGSFKYNVNSNLNNLISTRYFQRNKNIFVADDAYSYNENVNIKLIDELLFLSLLKLEFDTGSNKFTHNNSKESFSFYTFQLNSKNSFITKYYKSSLVLSYFKHQYKSLTLSNSEDRDILKFHIEPSISYNLNNILEISQSFPLEFYHLINISAEKSSSNYIDRIINSSTNYHLYKNKPINLAGKISIQSYFRSYDYDETYSRSFIIKNYSFEDTINCALSDKYKLQLSSRYKYEEFGSFNYDKFTENPINFKNHYYLSFGNIYELLDKFNIKTEYYFYEIDAYDFDQSDFSNNFLRNVFIIHGPKLSSTFIYKNFSLFSSFNLDFYRDNQTKYNFFLQSGYHF